MKRINTLKRHSLLNALSLIGLSVSLMVPTFAQSAKTDYAADLAKMDEVLKTKPNNESAHYYRAVALQNLGQYQRAKADYEWVTRNSKNPTLVQYSTMALRALSATTGSHTQGQSPSFVQPSGQRPAQPVGRPSGAGSAGYGMLNNQ